MSDSTPHLAAARATDAATADADAGSPNTDAWAGSAESSRIDSAVRGHNAVAVAGGANCDAAELAAARIWNGPPRGIAGTGSNEDVDAGSVGNANAATNNTAFAATVSPAIT